MAGTTIEVLGEDKAIITDLNGEFLLEDIPRKASLRIRYLGYITKIVAVESLATTKCNTILLSERRELLKEVTVYQYLTKGIQQEKDASVTLDINTLGILPGLIEPDVLQTVQNLPGIKSIDERVSDINVRGGTNDQNLLLWNGIKIYQTGHFFGLISAFNPYLIDKVAIYKNGTPAIFGDGVSSVIALTTKNELQDDISGGGGLNFITADVYGQIPLNRKTDFQFSARRSYTDFLNTPTYTSFTNRVFQDTQLQTITNQRIDQNFERKEDFFFYDYSGKLLYDLNDDHQFRWSFIGMGNNLNYNETNLNNGNTSESLLDQSNFATGLAWKSKWSDTFSATLNVYYSNYDLLSEGNSNSSRQILTQFNEVDERAIRADTQWHISDAFELNSGYQYIETGITNRVDVTEPNFDELTKGVIRINAPYSQLQYTATEDSFIGSLGVRVNHIENLNTFSTWRIEPRINLNTKLANHLRVQLLGELKSQATNQVIDLEQNFLGIEKRRWILSDNQALPVTKSQQVSLEFNYENNGLYVGLAGFFKNVDGISILTQGFQNEGQFNGDEVGEYQVYGVEFLLNKKGDNYSTWLSYTLNNNEYTFTEILDQPFPNNLDVRHAINAATTFDIKNLQLAVGFNYRTGRPFTEPNRDNPLNEFNFPRSINYNSPNSSRLPDYFRADASATYKWNVSRRTRAVIGISILNVFNQKNVLNRYYRLAGSNEIEVIENTSLGFTPNATFRIMF